MRALLLVLMLATSPGWAPTWAIDAQQGWPMVLPDFVAGFCAADLNGDGVSELIVNDWMAIFALNPDGSPVAGSWPRPSNATFGRPLVGDIDGDGSPDVVANSDEWGPSLVALAADGTMKPGWPLLLIDALGPLYWFGLADLDGDGADEVVVPARARSVFTNYGPEIHTTLYAIRGDGTPLPGWPVDLNFDPWFPVDSLQDDVGRAGMATGDLDFDGHAEVVVCFDIINNGNTSSGMIFVFNADGTLRPGWPKTGGSIQYPLIADLNGDFECEVIAGGQGSLRAWRPDGSIYMLPLSLDSSREPVCGDLDGDGILEIVVPGGLRLNVVNIWDGPVNGVASVVATTPLGPYEFFRGVTIGDVNGDGTMEIAAISDVDPAQIPGVGHVLHLFDSSLQELPGWPQVSPPGGISAFPGIVMADLDGDNDLELVDSSWFTVHVWDVLNRSGGPVKVEWGQRGHGPKGGSYRHEAGPPPPHYLRGDRNRDGVVDVSDLIGLLGYMFLGGVENCEAALDGDGDGSVSLGDAIFLVNRLFLSGPPLSAPYPSCQTAGGMSTLPCLQFSCP